MNTTENLSLDLYNHPEDKSTSNVEIINAFSKNFKKIDEFSKDIENTIHTIHGLHDTKTDEVITVDDADEGSIFRKISFDLPEGHSYVGMLPDTTHDNIEIDSDGNVELVSKIWHKKLKISDMDNAEDYPGWSIPKDDELMSYLQDNSHTLVSCVNSIGIQLKMNTVGDTIRIFGEKADFDGLTQPELITKYPETYVDIYGKIETQEVRTKIGKVDPVLVPSSNMNVWTEGNMVCDTQIDYPRDINIIIKKIEEQLNALTNNS